MMCVMARISRCSASIRFSETWSGLPSVHRLGWRTNSAVKPNSLPRAMTSSRFASQTSTACPPRNRKLASRCLGVMSMSASSWRRRAVLSSRFQPVENDARRLVDAERADKVAPTLGGHLAELEAVANAVKADVRSRHLRPVGRGGSVVDAVVEDDHVGASARLQLAVEEDDLLRRDVPALSQVPDRRVDAPRVHQPREVAGDRLVVGCALAPGG